MADLVIPLLQHTDNDYLDLRFALRGFDLYLKPERVFLIGAKPAWVKNVEYIPATDVLANDRREENMFRKLLLYPGEEFIYANDDHFLIAPWHEQYAWDVTLLTKFYSLGRGSNYQKTVNNTLRIAPQGKNYDVHCPMLMHRSILKNLQKLPWYMSYGFCLKSVYAHAAKLNGTQVEDLKIRSAFKKEAIDRRTWFSTADGVVEKSLSVFGKLFPKKSRYE